MPGTPVCLVCEVEMVKGFVADHGPAMYLLPRWVEGEPKPNWWTGGEARAGQVTNEGYKVIAYRCPECHALRLYAIDDET